MEEALGMFHFDRLWLPLQNFKIEQVSAQNLVFMLILLSENNVHRSKR